MAEYIGIDLHKQTSYVTKMDAQGKILEQRNLRNDPDTLRGSGHALCRRGDPCSPQASAPSVLTFPLDSLLFRPLSLPTPYRLSAPSEGRDGETGRDVWSVE